jgi:hypothetical protein
VGKSNVQVSGLLRKGERASRDCVGAIGKDQGVLFDARGEFGGFGVLCEFLTISGRGLAALREVSFFSPLATPAHRAFLLRGGMAATYFDTPWSRTAMSCTLFPFAEPPANAMAVDSNVDDDLAQRLLNATRMNQVATLRLLLVQQASLTECTHGIMNKKHMSLLYCAAKENHVMTCRLLLDLGHDVECGSVFGISPLYVAVHRGNVEVCKLLLSNNAQATYEMVNVAAMRNDPQCLEHVLLSMTEEDFNQGAIQVAIDLAVAMGKAKAAKYLRRALVASPLELACDTLNLWAIEAITSRAAMGLNICAALACLSKSPQKKTHINEYRQCKNVLVNSAKRCACERCKEGRVATPESG